MIVMLRRLIAVGSVGVLCSSFAAHCAETESKWQFGPRLSPNGFVRFGRAAVALSCMQTNFIDHQAVTISYDYKRTLWGVDSNSPEYTNLKSQVHLRSAAKLRDLCCINGGVFIKAGQYIGSLDYLLPSEYVQTMKVLHSDAPQSELKDIHYVIEEELGQPVSKIFQHFEPKPLGAASLAQVHKATLHDGRVVAVKVQHRDVQEHAAVDTATIEFLVRTAAWIFPEFRFLWLVEETKKKLPLELDFLHEGRNAEKMAKLFKGCSFLKIPDVYWELSTKRVLMMEFCEGGKVDDLNYMKLNNISSDEVSRKIGQLYSEMIFVHGYVHCDPHPGNVYVRKDLSGKHVEIVLLDHGLYQTLTDDFRINYCKMWQSLISADLDGIKRSSEDLGVGDMYGLLACMLTARSWDVVTSGINQKTVSEKEKNQIRENATKYLNLISDLLNRVPRQLLLLFKTNDLLRSIDHTLNTSATARSFITMARCCVRAVTTQRLEQCHTWYCRLGVYFKAAMSHIRITCYQLSESNIGSFFLRIFESVRRKKNNY